MIKKIAEITPINEPFQIGEEGKKVSLQTTVVRFTDLSSGLMYWNTARELSFKEGQSVEVSVENMKPFKFGSETFDKKVRLSETTSNDTSVESDTNTPQEPKKFNRPNQESIVFQNQSHLVQQYFKNCNICPDLMDISMATDLQVRWAIEGFSKELMERFEKFQQYIDEKYKG